MNSDEVIRHITNQLQREAVRWTGIGKVPSIRCVEPYGPAFPLETSQRYANAGHRHCEMEV